MGPHEFVPVRDAVPGDDRCGVCTRRHRDQYTPAVTGNETRHWVPGGGDVDGRMAVPLCRLTRPLRVFPPVPGRTYRDCPRCDRWMEVAV